MSDFRRDTLGSRTRGGQAIVHHVRLTTEAFYQTFLAGLMILIIGTIWYALEKSSSYERFVLLKVTRAAMMGDTVPENASTMHSKTRNGVQYWTSHKALIESGFARQALSNETDLLHLAAIAGAFALLMLFWAWFYFARTGRGLAAAIDERERSPIRLEAVAHRLGATRPLSEPQHTTKTTARRCIAGTIDSAPELPRALSWHQHDDAANRISEKATRGAPLQPEISLLAKAVGFRLHQHGRRLGDRDMARPA